MFPTYLFKIFLIGKKGVGKSTFVRSPYISMMGDDIRGLVSGVYYGICDYPFNSQDISKVVRYQVWVFDPAKRFKFLFESYILGSQVIFVMFDVSDLTSLSEIDLWVETIRKRCDNVPILLIGNKSDLTEHLERAKILADNVVKKHNLMGYYEVSALESKDIESTFKIVTDTILEQLNLKI